MNPILMTDSYKVSHHNLYPPGMNYMYSYLESRGGVFPATVFFGLQYYLKEYLSVQITPKHIDQAEKFYASHFGRTDVFNRAGFEHIVKAHNGYWPVRIKAVPEGLLVPTGNILMSIESTDPVVPWVVNYIETLLMKVWYPITVATQSYYMKKDILKYLEKTGTPESIDFRLHDFGYRGVSSEETAAIGAAAHLLNFLGTDTTAGILFLQEYYNTMEMVGFSVPATEHSVFCSWDRKNESDAMRNALEKYPSGIVACVSDQYDIFNACENIWGDELKDMVLSRDGVLVIRPDSGNPHAVLPRMLDILANKFGFTVNDKGYKELNPKVRIIQGDGVSRETIPEILETVTGAGYSANNLTFGSGGALLQKVDRDTSKFAFKCSYVEVNGVGRNVYKDPITDPGKTSKQGKLTLIKTDNEFKTVNPRDANSLNLLIPVWENGRLLRNQNLKEVKETLEYAK